MIIDSRLEFADAVSVAAAAGTALIGSQVDTGAVQRDIGSGEDLYLVINVDTAIITGGVAGTVQFALCSDDTASIATNGTASYHWTSKAFATGATAVSPLRAGDTIAAVELPMEGQAYERYLGILCVTGTTTTTAGKINAFLTKEPAVYKMYARATN